MGDYYNSIIICSIKLCKFYKNTVMSEKEYREKEALHFSMLSSLDKSPRNVFEPSEFEAGYGMIFGDLTDKILTGGDVTKDYYLMNSVSLSDNIKNVIELIYKNSWSLSDIDNVRSAAKECEYGNSYLDKTLLNKVKAGKAYLDHLFDAGDKKVIPKEWLVLAEQAADSFKTHPFTAEYFNPEGVEVIFQKEIYWIYRAYECKALLDMIHVDHTNKIVYPFDIKTTGDSVFKFEQSVMKFRYYLQAAWYTLALTYEYPEYKIENFKFLVINNENPSLPLVYKCSDSLLLAGADGGTYNGRKIKGYTQLINDYTWHLNSNKYQYSKELYDCNGELELDMLEYE